MVHPAQIERFQVVRLLGSGGMGHVYEALDTDIDRRVAIKVLRRELLAENPEILQRLFVEARAANAIGHPGVVQISEAKQLGDDSGYLVMEYLNGQTLTQRLSQLGGSLPVATALDIAIQIASTLRAGHERGVVHRDLKPDNIMLVHDDAVAGGERVKILDFGIAKLVRASVAATPLTLADMGMGTPGYMAPEQIRDAAQASDRCDVYGLGAVLFEMLAGRRAHVAATHADVMVQVLCQDAPPVSEFVDGVPPVLVQLIQSQLIREPATARPSIVEVLRQLYLARAALTAVRTASIPIAQPPSSGEPPERPSSAPPSNQGKQPVGPTSQQPQIAIVIDERSVLSSLSESALPPPSASTLSHHTGQQLGASPVREWTTGRRWTIPIAALLLGGFFVLLREKRAPPSMPQPAVSQKPTPEESPKKTLIDLQSNPLPVSTPTVFHQVDSSGNTDQPSPARPDAPLEPRRDERAVSSTNGTSVPMSTKLVHSPPKVAKSTACQLAPSLLLPTNNPQVSQAIFDAAKTYQLRLCKGEKLTLKRNAQDGVLSPVTLPPSLKSRSSFDMHRFLLRVQGSLSSVHDESLRLIVLGS
jgi:serine/threonine-protein kinase